MRLETIRRFLVSRSPRSLDCEACAAQLGATKRTGRSRMSFPTQLTKICASRKAELGEQSLCIHTRIPWRPLLDRIRHRSLFAVLNQRGATDRVVDMNSPAFFSSGGIVVTLGEMTLRGRLWNGSAPTYLSCELGACCSGSGSGIFGDTRSFRAGCRDCCVGSVAPCNADEMSRETLPQAAWQAIIQLAC